MKIKFKTLRNTILLTLCTLAVSTTQAADKKATVYDVKTDYDTTNLYIPSSFDIDTHDLKTEWYLNRYTEMENNATGRKTVSLSDEDYIERLQKLPTTIDMTYNNVVKSFIRMYVERRKEVVETILGMSIYYGPIIDNVFDRYGLPLELRNLAVIESALVPYAVSKSGAAGLWQFMAATGKDMGLEINSLIDERLDPFNIVFQQLTVVTDRTCFPFFARLTG